jgi:hypothetical protein
MSALWSGVRVKQNRPEPYGVPATRRKGGEYNDLQNRGNQPITAIDVTTYLHKLGRQVVGFRAQVEGLLLLFSVSQFINRKLTHNRRLNTPRK